MKLLSFISKTEWGFGKGILVHSMDKELKLINAVNKDGGGASSRELMDHLRCAPLLYH